MNTRTLSVELFLVVLKRSFETRKWQAFFEGNRIMMKCVNCEPEKKWTPLTVVIHELSGLKINPDEEARVLAVNEEFPLSPTYQIYEITNAEDGREGHGAFNPQLQQKIREIIGLSDYCPS